MSIRTWWRDLFRSAKDARKQTYDHPQHIGRPQPTAGAHKPRTGLIEAARRPWHMDRLTCRVRWAKPARVTGKNKGRWVLVSRREAGALAR